MSCIGTLPLRKPGIWAFFWWRFRLRSNAGVIVLGGEGDGQLNAEVVEGSLGDVHGQVCWLPVSFLEDVRVEGLEPPRRSTRS